MRIDGGFSLDLEEFFWSWEFFAIFSFLTALGGLKSNSQMKKIQISTKNDLCLNNYAVFSKIVTSFELIYYIS